MIEKLKGFVTIPRDIQTLPLWGNAYDASLWLYCVLHASHTAYQDLQPGQFYASQVQIAKVMHWSRKTVSTSLRRLAAKGLLAVQTSDEGTVITVNHWAKISTGRGLGDGDMMVLDTSTGEVSRVLQRSRGKPETLVDQVSESQKTSTMTDPVREQQFERFWQAYPKKSSKTETKRFFMQMDADPEGVINAIEQARHSPAWMAENGRFIPNPVSWLDGGWEQYETESAKQRCQQVEEEDDGHWVSL